MKLIVRCGLLGYLTTLVCACVAAVVAGGTPLNEGLTYPEWINFVTNAFIMTPVGLVAGFVVGFFLVLLGKAAARRRAASNQGNAAIQS